MLACFALYFLCEWLPALLPGGILNALALLIIPLGILDQVPKYPWWDVKVHRKGWEDYESDRVFFPNLEAQLPKGAMVFELPVHDFPESGPVLGMDDYEQFRPILHSRFLRVSYGAVKGRGDNDWQKQCSEKKPEEGVEDLLNRGFSAILINRKAYEDKGKLLADGFLKSGCSMLEENDDFLAIALPKNP
jgi:phosphoglycerol transferase